MKISFSALLVLSLFFTACGDKDKPNQPKPKELVYSDSYINGLAQAGTIVVVDEQSRPLANVSVLFGNELNGPFQNNLLKTDAKGMLLLPSEWTTPLSVTVDLPNYIRVTYLSHKPEGMSFRLKKKQGFPQYEISGETLGHDIKNYDDQLDFGLVAESMTREDILTFDINKIISPLSDVMSVIGFDLNIPGNLSIPRQKESYVLPLTLAKPSYRIRTLSPGNKRILALRGHFPFKAVVDELRSGDKSYADLINRFDLFGGVLQEINVTQERTLANLNTKAINFTGQVQIIAPFFKSQETFLAIGAAEDNGSWFPTDIKKVEPSQQQKLKLAPSGNAYVIGILKNKNEFTSTNSSRLSATVVPATSNSLFSMIPLIENPKVITPDEFLLGRPTGQIPKLNEVGTYAVLSSTGTLRSEIGEMQVILSREWEVFADEWVDTIKLPKFPVSSNRAQRRLEVTYLGNETGQKLEMGPIMIERTTHVTRSSVDF